MLILVDDFWITDTVIPHPRARNFQHNGSPAVAPLDRSILPLLTSSTFLFISGVVFHLTAV